MGKNKINKAGWGSAPNAFYVAAMRKTDDLNGGLYLALGSVAVKPTDAVDAKKEYSLAYITPQPEPTPVTPE